MYSKSEEKTTKLKPRQCECKTQKGQRCKRETIRADLPYCSTHKNNGELMTRTAGAGASLQNLPCKIFTIYKNKPLFKAFKKKAEQQSRNFIHVFPWKVDDYKESYIIKECAQKRLSLYEVMLNYAHFMSRIIPKDVVKYNKLEKIVNK